MSDKEERRAEKERRWAEANARQPATPGEKADRIAASLSNAGTWLILFVTLPVLGALVWGVPGLIGGLMLGLLGAAIRSR